MIIKGNKKLRDQKQNGFSIGNAINDHSKNSEAEKFNSVLLAPIFERLWMSNTLCPSNYIYEVIKELTIYEMKHNLSFSHEFYCGFISRSLRAFASYIREKSLEIIIYNFFEKYCKEKNLKYSFNTEDKIKEDIKNKTDILVCIENIKYRIWSFQSTNSGCICTKRRALQAKPGVNIFIPFNISKKQSVFGWFLYNEKLVIEDLKSAKTEKFKDFKQNLENPYILKTLHKVYVT